MSPSVTRVAVIEAGGTSIRLDVYGSRADAQGRDPHLIATGDPHETTPLIEKYLLAAHEAQPLDAVAIASFGPLEIATGRIALSTPKISWRGFSWTELVAAVDADLPIFLDTDVNAAALAEATWGVARDIATVAYLTVGTGIGAGVVNNRAVVMTRQPREVGHVYLRRLEGDDFDGVCPSHHDCAEGLASGPALLARAGQRGEDIPVGDVRWTLEAHYIAQVIHNLTMTVAPDAVVLGGGVLDTPGLRDLVREQLVLLNGDYLELDVDRLTLAPSFGHRSGLVGAAIMAGLAG